MSSNLQQNAAISQICLLPILICFFSSAVLACTCVDYGVPSCKLFGDADAVFIGKIERIVPANDDKAEVSLSGVGSISSRGSGLISVQFSIEKAYKGVTGKSVKALTYTGTSCDLEVKEGQKWLIFASKDGKTNLLGFGACGGNRPIDDSTSDSKEFDEILAPNSPPAIHGRVSLNQYDGVKGAKVDLNGQGIRLSTESDVRGSYSFQVPRAGNYSIKVSIPFSAGLLFSSPKLPPKFKAEEPTETASNFTYDAVAKLGTCDYQYFDAFKIDLKATASISGKFQYDWKNFRKFYPAICRLQQTEKETLQSCDSLYGELRPDGSFSFDGLREGRYTIVVGDDFPNGPEPFFRHYYPGVKDFSKAQVIEIRQGEQRRGTRFKLPSILPTSRVRGQIFTSDGRPAILKNDDGRYFYLAAYFIEQRKEPQLFFQHSYRDEWTPASEGKEIEMISSKTDGSFDLELFEGFTYILKVESGQTFDGYSCGFLQFTINKNQQEPLKIILDKKLPCDVKEFARGR